MDFTLTDEQQMLRDTARTLLAKECPPTLLRAVIDDPAAAAPLDAHLAEWTVLADGDLVDLCLFLEECGAVLAPGPFFATAALYQPLVRAAGLDPAASGTVAMAGPDGVWVANDAPTKTFVLEADRVDEVAVVGQGGVVRAAPGELAMRPVQTLDLTRRVFEVDTAGLVGEASPFEAGALAAVLQRAYVALAAETLGTARRMLDMSVAYAKERVQFDRPIGSFQAIQHKLANMALDVERATAAVYYAAMCIDAGDDDRHRAAHVAAAAAGAAAAHCAKQGIQAHGGIGYTWEHDLHLYIRRAYTSEHLLGTSGWHHDRIADLILR